MAPSEKTSMGRRVSTLFGLTGGNSNNNNSFDNTAPRPVSRGRQSEPSKLRKGSVPWLHSSNSSQQQLPSSSPDVPPMRSANHSGQPSLDAFSLDAPRAPFAREATSTPGSRSASPATSSRNASPGAVRFQPPPLPPKTNAPSSPAHAPTQQPKALPKRKSWMPMSKHNTQAPVPRPASAKAGFSAWIVGRSDKPFYDFSPLVYGKRVDDLWDDAGDVDVYLFPESSGIGPSFRVHASYLTASPMLTELRLKGSDLTTKAPQGDLGETQPIQKLFIPILSTGSLSSASRFSGQITEEDIQALLDVRNMFAFLIGQALVATDRRPSVFAVFLRIADSLQTYDFSNIDGSTFGEMAVESFGLYINELELRDVRGSREETIEMLLLAEKMRSEPLYHEAFVHAVGKYEDLQELMATSDSASHTYDKLLQSTRFRLERAHIDLTNRMASVNGRLEDFYFPMIFSGIMNSRTADERKNVRFDAWRTNFMAARKQTLTYYKDKYGSWPPRASAKKNNLARSGLSRPVLKQLYRDFSDLYDLLVDRNTLTARKNNAYQPEEDETAGEEPVALAMWRVLDEYDRSTPPVQPPVPFDIPLLPSLTTFAASTGDPKKDAKLLSRKLKDDEVARVLHSTRNKDMASAIKNSPFLMYMLQAEQKRARDSSIQQLVDQRAGLWVFIYSVLQTLPMIVVDAPDLTYDQGVEYHLCIAPMENVPWATHAERAWFETEEKDMVKLPGSLVKFGVDGVYRRSHCWVRGRKWSENLGVALPTPADIPEGRKHSRAPSGIASRDGSRQVSGLPVPESPYGAAAGTRSVSKDRRGSALHLGLESLPIPPGVSPFGAAGGGAPGLQPGHLHVPRSRPVSRGSRPGTREGSHGSASGPAGGGKSFDDIIADMNAEKEEKKKQGKDKKKK